MVAGMNGTNQLTTLDKVRFSWLIARPIIGGALGSIIYILIAKAIMDQPATIFCELNIRLVIEATLLPAWLLVGAFVDEPILYLLSSLPYAILGSSILNLKTKTTILVSICIICCFVLSFIFLALGLAISCSG